MKISKRKIIISLIVLLIIVIGYVIFDKYNERKQQEELSIFQQGAQYGYEQAITTLIQQAQTCQEVPIWAGNVSIEVISTKCLQAQGKTSG
ncbi:MAG: hypothetical protein AABW67_00190 [Nanoarchaeota archaeon]